MMNAKLNVGQVAKNSVTGNYFKLGVGFEVSRDEASVCSREQVAVLRATYLNVVVEPSK
jgi:hypothetical protein